MAVPPGRAGRLWLDRRLRIARRAADLLDRKLRILSVEVERCRAQAGRTQAEWEDRCRDAERWLLRAGLLGGERAVRPAADTRPAEVTIRYAVTMGTRHPQGAQCVTAEPGDWEGSTVIQARRAHGIALAAAAEHAAASAALAALQAELDTTRYRLRAVRDRWIPRLEEELARVEFSLDELERADAARLRQAARSPGRRATGDPAP